MIITNTGITILPQVTNERRTVEPQQLVPIGGATLIPRGRVSSTRRLGFDSFAVLFKTGQNFRAVMDLQNTVYVRVFVGFGPARCKNNPNNVFPGVSVAKLGDGVLGRLVEF